MNQVLQSLHGGPHEITITVPSKKKGRRKAQ